MKQKWFAPALAIGAILLFLWTARENFEDTINVQGPPYGNTAASAQRLINIMEPEMLVSLKTRMGVPVGEMTDAQKIKLIYGDGTNNSPIGQVMSDFYWNVYKPATVTIDVRQVNTFLGNRTDQWISANQAFVRNFLTRYFLQGQATATQSGYGDFLNSVLGGGVKAQTPVTKTTDKVEPTDPGTNWIVIAALALAGFSVLAVMIVIFLPARV